MHAMPNFTAFFDRLNGLCRAYDESRRAGAKSEQTTQIVTQLIPLLTQALQTPLAKEVGSALYDLVQNTWRQVTRDPYFTTAVAEYLRTRIKVVEDATNRFEDAFHEAGCNNQFGQPGPTVLVPTTVLDQVPVLLDILQRTAQECRSFSLQIPSSQSVLASQYLIGLENAGHGTALDVTATTRTSAQSVPLSLPALPAFPIPIKQRMFMTHGAKARHLLVKVMWFCKWLRMALRQRRNIIDQAGNLGLYDLVALSHAASTLVADTEKATSYCHQLNKDASSLLGYA